MLTIKEAFYWLKGLLKRQRPCIGKQKYSIRSVVEARATMTKKTGKKFDAYCCPWCRYWHIGRSVKER